MEEKLDIVEGSFASLDSYVRELHPKQKKPVSGVHFTDDSVMRFLATWIHDQHTRMEDFEKFLKAFFVYSKTENVYKKRTNVKDEPKPGNNPLARTFLHNYNLAEKINKDIQKLQDAKKEHEESKRNYEEAFEKAASAFQSIAKKQKTE